MWFQDFVHKVPIRFSFVFSLFSTVILLTKIMTISICYKNDLPVIKSDDNMEKEDEETHDVVRPNQKIF